MLLANFRQQWSLLNNPSQPRPPLQAAKRGAVEVFGLNFERPTPDLSEWEGIQNKNCLRQTLEHLSCIRSAEPYGFLLLRDELPSRQINFSRLLRGRMLLAPLPNHWVLPSHWLLYFHECSGCLLNDISEVTISEDPWTELALWEIQHRHFLPGSPVVYLFVYGYFREGHSGQDMRLVFYLGRYFFVFSRLGLAGSLQRSDFGNPWFFRNYEFFVGSAGKFWECGGNFASGFGIWSVQEEVWPFMDWDMRTSAELKSRQTEHPANGNKKLLRFQEWQAQHNNGLLFQLIWKPLPRKLKWIWIWSNNSYIDKHTS